MSKGFSRRRILLVISDYDRRSLTAMFATIVALYFTSIAIYLSMRGLVPGFLFHIPKCPIQYSYNLLITLYSAYSTYLHGNCEGLYISHVLDCSSLGTIFSLLMYQVYQTWLVLLLFLYPQLLQTLDSGIEVDSFVLFIFLY